MKYLSVRDARAQLSTLIDAVWRAPIAITRRGRVVAIMISPEEFDDLADFRAAVSRTHLRKEFGDRLSSSERRDRGFLDRLSRRVENRGKE